MSTPVHDPDALFAPNVDRAGFVQGMFSSIALRYDLMNTLMTGGRHHAWRRLAASELVRAGDTVIDVGCGTGDLSFACFDAGAARILGVDFARPMLPLALEKAHTRGFGRKFGVAAGDGTQLPLADQSVDAWCSAFVVRNIPDLDAALTEAWRVLKPGGRLAILEITKMKPGFWRPLARFHFTRIVPIAGRLISGHDSAYKYLPVSVDHFDTPEEFSARLANAGFDVEIVRSLMLGTIALHVARKPDAPSGAPSEGR
ncbi:MAG: ubiquinone/menaquinone biosynthesis methyltransferase [Dehalococcoidia bacterium]|jgi:demethylmenaquinone methyltransferase / 2-methoxy-6-polyprenyl-1,4-benzoquinol methylase|nr:ubiquinone/menaquinone biosynthesis methyltransferase [Dehalococcoidia bacterium]